MKQQLLAKALQSTTGVLDMLYEATKLADNLVIHPGFKKTIEDQLKDNRELLKDEPIEKPA